MAIRPNLFEYFAVDVPNSWSVESTEVTEQGPDEYDAPHDLLRSLDFLGSDESTLTVETRVDGDTYDKEEIELNSYELTEFATAITASTDAYDKDPEILSVPGGSNVETSTTKVDGETYDDQSVQSLSFPFL